MKIGGRSFNQPKTVLLVLPRQDGNIPLKFVAVNNDDDFAKINPRPKAPRVFKKSLGQTIDDVTDNAYVAKFDAWANSKTDWTFLQSIKPSDIVWDSVIENDPTTWKNWRNDLKKAGFSIGEQSAIFEAFVEANMVTDTMLKEARESFLVSQAAQALAEAESSLNSELTSTPSGTPATDLESSPQV